MSDINEYIKHKIGLFTSINALWSQTFCIYCNDKTRKHNPSHGHLYFSENINFFICFRCNERGELTELLKDLEYDKDLSWLQKSSTNYFNNHNRNKKQNIISDIENINLEFLKNNIADYKELYRYIYRRLGCIDISEFGIYFSKLNNNNVINFINQQGYYVTGRFINDRRYFKRTGEFYFFQDINELCTDKYKNIIIAEGIFDLLSLYNYGNFNNKETFYITNNGIMFNTVINDLLYFYITNKTELTIHLFYDKDVLNLKNNLFFIKRKLKKINNTIKIKTYLSKGKDINDSIRYIEI